MLLIKYKGEEEIIHYKMDFDGLMEFILDLFNDKILFYSRTIKIIKRN